MLVDMELSASFLTDLQYSFSYRSLATSWIVTQRIPNLRTCTLNTRVSDEKDHLWVQERSEVLHSFRRTVCARQWDGSRSSIQLQNLLQFSSRAEDNRNFPIWQSPKVRVTFESPPHFVAVCILTGKMSPLLLFLQRWSRKTTWTDKERVFAESWKANVHLSIASRLDFFKGQYPWSIAPGTSHMTMAHLMLSTCPVPHWCWIETM